MRKPLSPVHAGTIWEQFDYHKTNGYYLVKHLDDGHFSTASSFILQFDNQLRTLDVLHLAIAAENSLPIVTADKALRVRQKSWGLRVSLSDESAGEQDARQNCCSMQ